MQIGIIGTGMVGSAIAYSLASEGSAEKLILIDANKERAIAEAMDISHSTPFTFGARVVAGDYKDLKDAGIIVITAGANQKPGETRLDLLEKNVGIFKSIIPEVVKYAPNAILVIAANPVDIMTEVTLKLSGFPKNRVFGTGTCSIPPGSAAFSDATSASRPNPSMPTSSANTATARFWSGPAPSREPPVLNASPDKSAKIWIKSSKVPLITKCASLPIRLSKAKALPISA